MLNFKVDKQICSTCGECAKMCPAGVIDLVDGYPLIAKEKELGCYRCQHCFTICEPGAISIVDLDPKASISLGKPLIDPDSFETFIKGRRTIRAYQQEDLDPALIQRLLDVAWHAPSGKNERKVRFTLIDKREKLAEFREMIVADLSARAKENKLPQGQEVFGYFAQLWQQKKIDVIFRGAPHLIIASAPKRAVSPLPDCLIALSYFDLFAQSLGVGTVWSGLVKWVIDDILPETKEFLNIPNDHVIGYCMVFGKPAVKFARTAQRGQANIHIVR
ncbi:MAG: nitroreductase family protein [Candidatus Omnitrophica bacterium]|nr:nitroreductase family protein [Candidatus Omnitrophota bacterium]